MEEFPVVIVGAGPAGLTLALSLALHEVRSIILEKELGVNEDPRGVFLAGDAVRIFYQVGIGEEMDKIGHQVETVNFHRSNFNNPPFISLNQTYDTLQQAVPDGVLQIQPRLEKTALREKIAKSPYCTLRCRAKVVTREELPDGLIVRYEDSGKVLKRIKCSYLIGADGKTGVVRKQFLEPTAGIKQEVGLFKYTGTWVAANLKIHLPTPETHPKLSIWSLGLTPEDVYDLFWPSGWHFCSPPGKATACGRFGPMKERFWRHEFAEPDWTDSKDAEALLWEHLLPMLTRSTDSQGRPFHGEATFPKDCIEIRRCRPFTFCQKVVNKWFHKRTILIGDAAHVFPPFGGQGIACGIRDAHALAWRLALLYRLPDVSDASREKLLEAWSFERRQGVDDSARLTKQNGMLCNEAETWGFFILRKVITIVADIGLLQKPSQWNIAVERAGYKEVFDGFFLEKQGGGGKLAQVFVRSGTHPPLLSDELLKRRGTVMTLLIVSDGCGKADEAAVTVLLKEKNMPESFLSSKSLVSISGDMRNSSADYTCCPQRHLSNRKLRPGYKESSYIASLPPGTRYAIIRPDFIVFAAARSLEELGQCFELLNRRLGE